MYSIETLEHIDFELSSYCNARCPQCQRFDIFGNPHKNLNETHLNFDTIQKLPLDKFTNLRSASFIGNFGDPLMNPEIDDILDFFKSKKLSICTNASLRNTTWWQNLAKKYKNLTVTFCINGLADTHKLYRRNTSFEKIMENAEAFISHGGHAQWQFIVFKHNQHQIEDAKKLSEDLNFKKIFFMHSDRFDTNNIWKVYEDGKHVYNLEKADTQVTLRDKLNSSQNEKYWKKLYSLGQKENIECVWAKDKKIYIHSDGTVFPCCHIGVIKVGRTIEKDLFRKIVKNWNDININYQKFEDILNGPYYKEYFKNSLLAKPHPVCIENCNKITGKLYQQQLKTV